MQQKNSNLINPSYALIILFGLILLFSVNVIGFRSNFYSYYDTFFNPLLISSRGITRNIFYTFDEISNRGKISRENFELRKKLNELEELKSENNRLNEQLLIFEKNTNIKLPPSTKLQLFEVVTPKSINSNTPTITIRGGTRNGIKVGQEVRVSPNSLLGIVTEVFDNTSIITPFFSSEFKSNGRKINLPVYNVESTQNKGLLKEISEGEIRIRSISKDAAVNVGDMWATTNDLEEISPDLFIGKTEKVINEDIDGFQEVIIKLNFKLQEIRFVYIKDVE